MTDARLLVAALRDPATVAGLDAAGWTALISMARAESLFGTLAHRLADRPVPERVALLLAEARADAAQAQRHALWEAEMARRALVPLGVAPILLKGTAYLAAGLDAALGRSIGDLDILVPRDRLDEVERALIAAGWEWVKEDAYDDLYYRRWMHELPPLIHRERDRMIDVHHTILPLTHRRRPDAGALVEQSIPLPAPFGLSLSDPPRRPLESAREEGQAIDRLRWSGAGEVLRVLAPADMVVHAAAHLIADGDMAGGPRNLWDIDRLVRQFVEQPTFWSDLQRRAAHHDLLDPVQCAVRLAATLYGTPTPWPARARADAPYLRRLLARDGWGRQSRPVTRLGFYARSHWLRMPPLMLARHLWTKARRPDR